MTNSKNKKLLAFSLIELSIGYSANVGRFNGYVAEMIVFNRVLEASERAGIENYLAKKWGIPCCS